MSHGKYVQAIINSRTRLTPSSSNSGNFTYSFNADIKRIKEFTIDFVEVPYTFYTINSSNNVLVFNGATSITITPGNYNLTTLITEMNTKIAAAIGGSSPTVSFSPTTFHVTITMTAPFVVNCITTHPTSTFAPLLGFTVDSASATSATSNMATNISGPNFIYVYSAYFSNFIQNKVISGDNSYSNALVVIPVETSPGGAISYSSDVPLRPNTHVQILTSDIIDIKLYDEYNYLLNLNGVDWTMHMTFLIE